jgi:hypothetical protein
MGHTPTPIHHPHPAEVIAALVLIAALLPATLARRALARVVIVMSNRRPR